MNHRRLITVLIAATGVVAACGSDDEASSDTDPPAETEAPPVSEAPAETEATPETDDAGAPAGATLQLASSSFGDILVDGDGNTLYLFTPDARGESTCYDECETNWPIVGEITELGGGLDDSLLGTTERTNGDVQATYNGWPLYSFAADQAPGDTNGQGVGDVWWVLDAAGEVVGA